MKALICVVLLGAVMVFAGWVSFSDSEGKASVTIDKQEVKADTAEVVAKGKELIEDGKNAISDHTDDADDPEADEAPTTDPDNVSTSAEKG